MESRKSQKNVLIFCSILIIGCILLGLIFNESEKENNNYGKGEEYFHNYKVNEVMPLYISLEEVSTKYLSDLVSMVNYFPEDFYNILDSKSKTEFETYADFEYYVKRLKTLDFLDAKVVSYTSTVVDNKNAIFVKDKAGNNFVFIEDSINNYKVRIN